MISETRIEVTSLKVLYVTYETVVYHERFEMMQRLICFVVLRESLIGCYISFSVYVTFSFHFHFYLYLF